MAKKPYAVLSKAAIATLLVSVASTSVVFAKTDAILTKDSTGKYFQYDLTQLTADAVNNALGLPAPLFNDYASKTLVAFHDDNEGYIDSEKVNDAAVEAVLEHKQFVLDDYTENPPAGAVEQISGTVQTRIVETGTDGQEQVADGDVINPGQTLTVTSVSTVDPITVNNGTTADKLGLPTTVGVTLSDGTTDAANVTWDTSAFDGTKTGDVTINGTLSVPTGKTWTLTDAQKAVSVKVTVKEAALSISSATAIDATHVTVKFSKAIDPTKVVVSNFTILDKNSAPLATVSKAVLGTDGQTITLTLPAPLVETSQPYQLIVNKNAFAVDNNTVPISMSTTSPVVSNITISSATSFTVAFDKDVLDNTAGDLGTNVVVTDATDTTQAYTVNSASIVSGKLVVTTTQNLIAGHNYTVTIAKSALIDDFGTTNDALTGSFNATNNTTKPALSGVQYVKSASGGIDAIATFNIPVKNAGGNVNIKIQDIANYITSDNLSAPVLDSSASASTQTAEVAGLALANNQILIENVNSANGVNMTTGNSYGLVIAASEVQDTTLAGLQNDQTTATAVTNVDITPATLSALELDSATSVKLSFSEPVTYDSSKSVTLKGFDAAGASENVAVKVNLSSDGKIATLTPATSGEVFETALNSPADLSVATGAFVDAAENPSAFTNATGATVTDVAAPVLASSSVTDSSTIKLKFTEAITPVEGATLKATVDGVSDNFVVADDTITITGTSLDTAGGEQVGLASGLVEDMATTPNKNAAILATVADKAVPEITGVSITGTDVGGGAKTVTASINGTTITFNNVLADDVYTTGALTLSEAATASATVLGNPVSQPVTPSSNFVSILNTMFNAGGSVNGSTLLNLNNQTITLTDSANNQVTYTIVVQ